jgi:cytochrome P450
MELFSIEMRRNPFPIYDQFRSTSPVVKAPGKSFWMIFDFDGVKRALSDSEAFSSAATPAGSSGNPLEWLIFFDPPRHTKLRALIARAFTPRMIAGLEPRIRELSRGLLDSVIERGEMDLAADYSIPLPTMVIAEMLGIPTVDWPRFKRWSDAILLLGDTITGGSDESARAGIGFQTVTREMKEYLQDMIQRRRVEPTEDLLSKLVFAEVDGQRLSAAEILGFFQLLLLAGNETTTNLINNAILCLTESPDELARLRARIDLLPSAIEEVLRYRSPLQTAFRATRHGVEMHGQVIPIGALVLPMIGSANRDPEHFVAPGRFDITRDPNPHLAFGHGMHFCLGAPLSRLEARVALTDLLHRTKDLELTLDGPWQPRQAFHVHGPMKLPLRFKMADPLD